MITFRDLPNTGDHRGDSYSPGEAIDRFLGRTVQDAHLATVLPGAMRGNHYHRARHEVILVLYRDAWIFAWDTGEGTARQSRRFEGTGAVLIEVTPLASHAMRNDGTQPLVLLGLSNGPYDPQAPDAYARAVLEPLG
jgi:oxalate decarboxylase/phosphoglucose isomerase-like protein (cupin superfamily)